MVSEKTIIILITVAILLSAVSIAVTISTVNSSMIPEVQPPRVNIEQGPGIPDYDKGQVRIIVNKPPAG